MIETHTMARLEAAQRLVAARVQVQEASHFVCFDTKDMVLFDQVLEGLETLVNKAMVVRATKGRTEL